MDIEDAIDSAVKAVGLNALKPLQSEVIRSFTERNDVFVSLPTGYGKSFFYLLCLIAYLAVVVLSFCVYLPPHL